MKNPFSIITYLLIGTTVVSFAGSAYLLVDLCQSKAPQAAQTSARKTVTPLAPIAEAVPTPVVLDENEEASFSKHGYAANLEPEYRGPKQFAAKGVSDEYINTLRVNQYSQAQQSTSTVFAGTAVELETMIPLNAKFITAGQTIDLRVKYDIVVDRKIVIPAGSVAKAIVNDARRKKLFQKSKICIEPKYVQTPDGQYIPLSGRPAYFQSKDNYPLSTGTTLFASIAATSTVAGGLGN